MDNTEFFKQAGYGMMMHFGLYSVLGGEYRGRFGDNYAEWIAAHFAIPNSEYERLAGIFNPIYFDADGIIKFARDCGMKYFQPAIPNMPEDMSLPDIARVCR